MSLKDWKYVDRRKAVYKAMKLSMEVSEIAELTGIPVEQVASICTNILNLQARRKRNRC